MMRPRRFLPSISLLLAFEAVLRNRSATAAAKELNLTQSTVSRLVQSLEEQIGFALFVRERKQFIPTELARTYGRDVTRALDLIQRASATLAINPRGGALSLATLPTFGTRWLAPRLNRFLDAHPGISINLATRTPRFRFDAESFDAVIYFGQSDWPDARHLLLFEEHLTACASSTFLRRHPVRKPADLHALPLLQMETRPLAWDVWFAGQSATSANAGGVLMDNFEMMIQAAIADIGVALLPDYLAQREIEERRLRPLFKPAIPGSGGYHMAWPAEKDRYAPLVAFRNWLGEVCS